MDKPACMTEADWARWQFLNDVISEGSRSETPCRDCTPVFYAEMLSTLRCDGRPLTPQDKPRKPVDPSELWVRRSRALWRTYKAKARA
jgi:hypothetical protein